MADDKERNLITDADDTTTKELGTNASGGLNSLGTASEANKSDHSDSREKSEQSEPLGKKPNSDEPVRDVESSFHENIGAAGVGSRLETATDEWQDDVLRQSFFSRFRNNTTLLRFFGLIIVLLLLALEIVMTTQCAGEPTIMDMSPFIAAFTVAVCSIMLDILVVTDIYVSFELRAKIVVYVFEYVFLFAICIIGGTVYLSALFCIVLTQMYISLPKFRDQLILFIVSIVLYGISFFSAGYAEDLDMSDIAGIVGDVFVGLLILVGHFVVVNVLLGLYRLNRRLSASLKAEEESKEELKEVYEQLSQSAVYEERNRIAGDIHDTAGHALTTVIMQTEAAKKMLDTNPEEAKKAIISANMQAKIALDQMRDSVHLLSGRESCQTIKAAVENTCAQTMDGTEVKIMTDLDEVYVGDMQYRIIDNAVKEALSNGMRHGEATAFYIELRREDDIVRLLVSDNGKGLPEDYTEGYGLRKMRLSCEAIGAKMSISSEEGEGCELTLILPVGSNHATDRAADRTTETRQIET